jgi:hypothetical protein
VIRRGAGLLLTFMLYVFALVGGSGWDRGDPRWFEIALRLSTAALWLWWAVVRTVRHREESAQ